jgi:hypothetical protein
MTIDVLKSAVAKAKLGNEDRLEALHRLDAQARRLERSVMGPSLRAFVAGEMRRSHEYAGRSVFGFEPAPGADTDRPAARRQEAARNGTRAENRSRI